MRKIRYWSVTHAGALLRIYRTLEWGMIKLDPLWRRLGYARIENPLISVETVIKQTLFDCKMCGQCVLSQTGMACPMNCPKQLRNGPCGGVRGNGHCEVNPEMRCVWMEAIRGAENMPQPSALHNTQQPLNHARQGQSSWIMTIKKRSADREST